MHCLDSRVRLALKIIANLLHILPYSMLIIGVPTIEAYEA